MNTQVKSSKPAETVYSDGWTVQVPKRWEHSWISNEQSPHLAGSGTAGGDINVRGNDDLLLFHDAPIAGELGFHGAVMSSQRIDGAEWIVKGIGSEPRITSFGSPEDDAADLDGWHIALSNDSGKHGDVEHFVSLSGEFEIGSSVESSSLDVLLNETQAIEHGDWTLCGEIKAHQPRVADATPEPPNYRERSTQSLNVPHCGSCKMFSAGKCWGYGNKPVGKDMTCDSWAKSDNSLQQQAAAEKDELFIALKVSKLTADKLHAWAKEQDWPEGTELEDPSEYHITLLYSPEGHKEHKEAEWWATDNSDDVEVKSLEEFSSQERGDKKAIVLQVDRPDDEIKIRMNRLLDAAENEGVGVKRYPGGSKPHITIAYGPSLPKGIRPPSFTFNTDEAHCGTPRTSASQFGGDVKTHGFDELPESFVLSNEKDRDNEATQYNHRHGSKQELHEAKDQDEWDDNVAITHAFDAPIPVQGPRGERGQASPVEILDHLSLASVAHNLHYKAEQQPMSQSEMSLYAQKLLKVMGYREPDEATVNAALQAWQSLYPLDYHEQSANGIDEHNGQQDERGQQQSPRLIVQQDKSLSIDGDPKHSAKHDELKQSESAEDDEIEDWHSEIQFMERPGQTHHYQYDANDNAHRQGIDDEQRNEHPDYRQINSGDDEQSEESSHAASLAIIASDVKSIESKQTAKSSEGQQPWTLSREAKQHGEQDHEGSGHLIIARSFEGPADEEEKRNASANRHFYGSSDDDPNEYSAKENGDSDPHNKADDFGDQVEHDGQTLSDLLVPSRDGYGCGQVWVNKAKRKVVINVGDGELGNDAIEDEAKRIWPNYEIEIADESGKPDGFIEDMQHSAKAAKLPNDDWQVAMPKSGPYILARVKSTKDAMKTEDDGWHLADQSGPQVMYHVAPTKERARIQQHGLQPSDPAVANASEGFDFRSQPQGVYVWPHPMPIASHDDLWAVPSEQIQTMKPDPNLEGAYVIPHAVYPQLHSGGPESQTQSSWKIAALSPTEWTGDPETDRLIEEYKYERFSDYARGDYAPQLHVPSLARPGTAYDRCHMVATQFDSWMKRHGIDAPMQKVDAHAVYPDWENASGKEPFGARHYVNVVNTSQGQHMVDWSASQYGQRDSFPIVQPNTPDSAQRGEKTPDSARKTLDRGQSTLQPPPTTSHSGVHTSDPNQELHIFTHSLQNSETENLALASQKGYRSRIVKTSDNIDTRQFPDSIMGEEPSPSPSTSLNCTCEDGHKLDCPIHGLDAPNDRTMQWSLPETSPVGYPQDQPRTWTQAVSHAVTHSPQYESDAHMPSVMEGIPYSYGLKIGHRNPRKSISIGDDRKWVPNGEPNSGSHIGASEPYSAQMWHGSSRGDLGPIRPGFFATSHKPEAEGYAGVGIGLDPEDEGMLHSVSVNFQNPLHSRWMLKQEALAKAARNGHDGVVLHFPEDMTDPSNPLPERQWIYALDPSTIQPNRGPIEAHSDWVLSGPISDGTWKLAGGPVRYHGEIDPSEEYEGLDSNGEIVNDPTVIWRHQETDGGLGYNDRWPIIHHEGTVHIGPEGSTHGQVLKSLSLMEKSPYSGLNNPMYRKFSEGWIGPNPEFKEDDGDHLEEPFGVKVGWYGHGVGSPGIEPGEQAANYWNTFLKNAPAMEGQGYGHGPRIAASPIQIENVDHAMSYGMHPPRHLDEEPERPVIYHPKERILYVGKPGGFHSDLENSTPGASIGDIRGYGRLKPAQVVDNALTEEWEDNPEAIDWLGHPPQEAEEIHQALGVRTPEYDWNFNSRTAAEDWELTADQKRQERQKLNEQKWNKEFPYGIYTPPEKPQPVETPADARLEHQHYWQPGTYGKGILFQNGNLHTWNVEGGPDGVPFHAHHLEEEEIPSPAETKSMIYINPDGDIAPGGSGSMHPESAKQIEQADPRLKSIPLAEGYDWNFNAMARGAIAKKVAGISVEELGMPTHEGELAHGRRRPFYYHPDSDSIFLGPEGGDHASMYAEIRGSRGISFAKSLHDGDSTYGGIYPGPNGEKVAEFYKGVLPEHAEKVKNALGADRAQLNEWHQGDEPHLEPDYQWDFNSSLREAQEGPSDDELGQIEDSDPQSRQGLIPLSWEPGLNGKGIYYPHNDHLETWADPRHHVDVWKEQNFAPAHHLQIDDKGNAWNEGFFNGEGSGSALSNPELAEALQRKDPRLKPKRMMVDEEPYEWDLNSPTEPMATEPDSEEEQRMHGVQFGNDSGEATIDA